MHAFRIALAALALAAGVFWIAVGVAIVADGNVAGWGGVLVGVGLGMRGWWIARTARTALAERRARQAPQPPRPLVWPDGAGRGFDWEGEPLPTVQARVDAVRARMEPGVGD